MLFAILCTDKPGRQDLRAATRPKHLAYLQSQGAKLVEAGPILDMADKSCGSLLIVDVADRAAAEALAAGDPYAQAGLFEATVIRPYRGVFRAGQQIAG